eukprot:12413878-Alexandrium_andersonii.AAC.1
MDANAGVGELSEVTHCGGAGQGYTKTRGYKLVTLAIRLDVALLSAFGAGDRQASTTYRPGA